MTLTAAVPAPSSAPGVEAPTRVVTGLKPTGRLHIGNYLGAIRPTVDLARTPGTRTLVFVADLHAMTIDHDPALLRERRRELAATLLACGLLDATSSTTLFAQSDVPAHCELAYLLECTATYGEMARMIQFKEKVRDAGETGSRLSLLTYPALMAADILLYDAHAVPVGEDQRQHLELARDLAERFNARYGSVFRVPRALTPPAASRVRSLRDPAAKMGKSATHDTLGTVYLLDTPTRVAATVRKAVTDTDPALTYDPELRPGIANLADLLAALTGTTPQAALAGLRGAGALKAAVTEALVRTLGPVRERYDAITADAATLDAVLAAGAEQARALAAPTLAAARRAVGLS